MNKRLLKNKELTSLEKLIIMLVMDTERLMIPFNLTSQEIGIELGVSRKKVLDALNRLQELDYIKCKVQAPTRYTKLTDRLKTMIT